MWDLSLDKDELCRDVGTTGLGATVPSCGSVH